MATYTPNLNLTKPDMEDYADIGVLNDNFDKIDNQFSKKLDYLPLTGGTLSGNLKFSNNESTITTVSDSTHLKITNANNVNKGASLYLYGQNSDEAGGFAITANTESNDGCTLKGTSTGSLTWNAREVLTVDTSEKWTATNVYGDLQSDRNNLLNGECWRVDRYPDGTQVVYMIVRHNFSDNTKVYTFPLPFKDDHIFITWGYLDLNYDRETMAYIDSRGITATGFRLYNYYSSRDEYQLQFVGRWK